MGRLCLLLLLVLGTSRAIAQTVSEPLRGAEIVSEAMELDAKRTGSARFFDPHDGQLDLSYFLEDLRGFLPIPQLRFPPSSSPPTPANRECGPARVPRDG